LDESLPRPLGASDSISACTALLRRPAIFIAYASAVFSALALAKTVVIVVKLISFVSSLASLTKSWNSPSSISSASAAESMPEMPLV
jgi:hypothetical protein